MCTTIHDTNLLQVKFVKRIVYNSVGGSELVKVHLFYASIYFTFFFFFYIICQFPVTNCLQIKLLVA